MAKLFDKLMNRVIKGKLKLESDDDISSLKEVDLHVKSINAKGGAISGSLAVTDNMAVGGDLDVNKDVRSKTLKQSEANWELEFTATPPSEDFSYVGGYQALKQVNGELHLIYVACFKNISDSAKTFQFQYPYIDFDLSEMPLELRQKIYDMAGKTLDEPNPPADESYIRIAPMAVSAQGSGNYIVSCPIIHRIANHLQISFGNSFGNVPANGYVRLSLEVNLDII